jgi:hypothetical protein
MISRNTARATAAPPGLTRALVLLMAVSVGLIVGNLYYILPRRGEMAG